MAHDRLSLNEFERWVDPYVWDVDGADAQDLMDSIQLLFSERNDGCIGADDLRKALFGLYSDMSIAVAFGADFAPVVVRDRIAALRPSAYYLVNPQVDALRAVA